MAGAERSEMILFLLIGRSLPFKAYGAKLEDKTAKRRIELSLDRSKFKQS
jgi:hypothetical protein